MKKTKIVLLMIIILAIILPSMSNAFNISSADLYSKGCFYGLLRFEQMNLECNFVVYNKDGVEYPAYCLQRELPGVASDNGYSVSIENLLTNTMVWKTIINGYPYKTYTELGCQTKEEAYFATKQAVYCTLYNREVSKYSAQGEAGERTIKAMEQILNAAKNSTQNKISSDIKIKEKNSSWEVYNLDKESVVKNFEIVANAPTDSYTIKLEGELPEGTKIVDNQGNIKSNFNKGEKFQIVIPIINLIKSGSFTIMVNGQVATKPILYGKSGNSSTQDYALTGSIYEEGSGSQKINYNKNETKILILKQQQENKMPLEGVKFELLDFNKEVVYTDLETNKDGEILIENIIPGMYYIKEVSTLEGYILYDKLIELEVDLNETARLIVNNSVEKTEIKNEVIETKTEVSNNEVSPKS